MITTFAIVWASFVLFGVITRLRTRYLSSSQLARFVEQSRGVVSEAHVFRVATEAERKNAPSVNVDGMRELGGLATTVRGTTTVSRYVIDQTRTIVATRHGEALFVSSIAGDVEYSTYCLRAGLPCTTPDVQRKWFRIDATDGEMLIAHRARIAKAAAPLVPISTIEQLAEIHTKAARRCAEWRAAQPQDELFEADLRSILRDKYEKRAAAVKAKLGSLAPRARVVS